MSGLWVKLDRDESAAFAALSLRARGLHALLSKVSGSAGIVDARATDTRALAAEIARRLGATAGDRRWLAGELDELVSAGFLGRVAGEWVLVSGASKPSRTLREPNANATRTEHEPDANATRTLHEPNTKTDASPRNDSTAVALSPDPSSEERRSRGEGACTHEPARVREGQPAPGGWWLDPWAVVNRLRERSQGKLQLTLNGHERELARTLTALASQRPRLADELDHWADLCGRGEASWWRGAWTIGSLLGRADETGRRAADGLLRCLDEAAARMPSKRPALRSVRPAEPVDVMTPERAQQLVAEARAKRAAQREVANG